MLTPFCKHLTVLATNSMSHAARALTRHNKSVNRTVNIFLTICLFATRVKNAIFHKRTKKKQLKWHFVNPVKQIVCSNYFLNAWNITIQNTILCMIIHENRAIYTKKKQLQQTKWEINLNCDHSINLIRSAKLNWSDLWSIFNGWRTVTQYLKKRKKINNLWLLSLSTDMLFKSSNFSVFC